MNRYVAGRARQAIAMPDAARQRLIKIGPASNSGERDKQKNAYRFKINPFHHSLSPYSHSAALRGSKTYRVIFFDRATVPIVSFICRIVPELCPASFY